MFNQVSKWLVTCVVVGILLPSAYAAAGSEGHGGNQLRSYFFSKAETILAAFRSGRAQVGVQIDTKKMEELLDTLDVDISPDPLKWKGKDVDAINELPEKKHITLYERTWRSYMNLGVDTYSLIFHELTPYFGVDDSRHQVSRQLRVTPPEWTCQAWCTFGEFYPNQTIDVVREEPTISEGDTAGTAYMGLKTYCDKLTTASALTDWPRSFYPVQVHPNRPGVTGDIPTAPTIQNSCIKN